MAMGARVIPSGSRSVGLEGRRCVVAAGLEIGRFEAEAPSPPHSPLAQRKTRLGQRRPMLRVPWIACWLIPDLPCGRFEPTEA